MKRSIGSPARCARAQAGAPWRAVKALAVGPANKPPDPHEYVIFGWQDVAREQFDGFVALIRAEGYRGRYTPPYDPSKTMTNDWFPIHEEPRTRRQVPPRAPGKG